MDNNKKSTKLIPLELLIDIFKFEIKVIDMETIIIKEIKQQIKKYCYNAINILTCSKVFYIFIGGIFKERKSYFSIYLQTMANVEKRIEELERELSDVKKENAAKIEQLENELSEVKRENAAIKKELSDVKQFIYITNNLLLPNGACCEKNCILLNDACQNNCGFVSIGGGGQTALYNEGEVNREIQLVCQNAFLPMFPYKQSMYYFEAKIKHLQDEDFVFKLEIGLEADNCCVKLYIESNKHDYQLGENFDNEGNEYEMEDSSESQKDNGYGIDFLRDGANAATVNVDEIPLNVDDTIGCGIVLPGIQNGQNNSYIFFTFNKVKIGKSVSVDGYIGNFKPILCLRSVSVDMNFGSDSFKFNLLMFMNNSFNEVYAEDEWDREVEE